MSRLLRLRPAADEHWFVLARITLARGRESEALEALGHVGDAYPQAAVAQYLRGAIALRHRRAPHGRGGPVAGHPDRSESPGPRHDLILLYCLQRRREELSEQFEALSRLTPLDFNQMLLWSSSLAASWDPSEAAPPLEEFVKADPGDRHSRLRTLAEALHGSGESTRPDRSWALCPPATPRSGPSSRRSPPPGETTANSSTPDRPAVRDRHPVLARMRLDLSRRDLPAAIAHLHAAAADPHNRAVLFQLGDNLTRQGNGDEGRKYVAAARDLDALHELLERVEAPSRGGGCPTDGPGRRGLAPRRPEVPGPIMVCPGPPDRSDQPGGPEGGLPPRP